MSEEYYKEKLKEIREEIKREEDAMKADNAYYAELIRNTNDKIAKFTYRSIKDEVKHQHEMNIEQLKTLRESTKMELAVFKKG